MIDKPVPEEINGLFESAENVANPRKCEEPVDAEQETNITAEKATELCEELAWKP